MHYFNHKKGHPMNTPNNHRSIHPVMVIAAVAVVLFCGVGSAAILGWLPTSNASGTVPGAAPMPGQLSAAPEPQVAYNNAAPAPQSQSPAQNPDQDRAPEPVAKQAPTTCANCGVVESVRSVEHRPQASGVGAVGGAVLGGLLGNQIGSGHGRQAATVAGAVGGAVAGNHIEGNMKTTHTWNVVVRMDNGSKRTISQSSQPSWRSGDAVRVVKGQLRSID
jgi:outer membrane lipoprotein SlyB